MPADMPDAVVSRKRKLMSEIQAFGRKSIPASKFLER
jgi:hypothetical protein